jgi:hypothetical protein
MATNDIRIMLSTLCRFFAAFLLGLFRLEARLLAEDFIADTALKNI